MEAFSLHLPKDRLASFCERWGITELALFGSGIRGELGPESDLDFLVSFESSQSPSLLDMAEMEMELEEMCGREVELVSRRAVEQSENSIRRTNILASAQPIIQRMTRE